MAREDTKWEEVTLWEPNHFFWDYRYRDRYPVVLIYLCAHDAVESRIYDWTTLN